MGHVASKLKKKSSKSDKKNESVPSESKPVEKKAESKEVKEVEKKETDKPKKEKKVKETKQVVEPSVESKKEETKPKESDPKGEIEQKPKDKKVKEKKEKKEKSDVIEPKKESHDNESKKEEVVKTTKEDNGETVTESLDVPKKYFGMIIGPKGATIKDIKSRTKAEIELPEQSSSSTDVKITGTRTAVKDAINEIKKIMNDKEAEHQKLVDDHEKQSQDTGKIYSKYQKDIDAAAKERTELYAQADKEYEAGNKDKAHELREQGKKKKERMEELQKQANTEIFKSLNDKYADHLTIDLHGLHVDVALGFLEERINELKKSGKSPLVVIYGAGNHSDKDGAKIKPAVQKYFGEKSFEYSEINNGSVSLAI